MKRQSFITLLITAICGLFVRRKNTIPENECVWGPGGIRSGPPFVWRYREPYIQVATIKGYATIHRKPGMKEEDIKRSVSNYKDGELCWVKMVEDQGGIWVSDGNPSPAHRKWELYTV